MLPSPPTPLAFVNTTAFIKTIFSSFTFITGLSAGRRGGGGVVVEAAEAAGRGGGAPVGRRRRDRGSGSRLCPNPNSWIGF